MKLKEKDVNLSYNDKKNQHCSNISRFGNTLSRPTILKVKFRSKSFSLQ